MKLPLGFALLGALLVWAAPATAADFSITPSEVQNGVTVVRAGTTITFEGLPGGPGYSWDLDGDGILGDQVGSPVQWAYAAPGPVNVTQESPDGLLTKSIQVIGPSANFVSFPAAPVAGQEVKFVYSQREDVEAIEWDLNGDQVFGDAAGPVATTTFPAPGTYAVSLRVTNLDTPPARSTSTRLITVVPAPLTRTATRGTARLMSPFPVVRITGKVGRRGARIKRLTVRAPFGSTVSVRCRGKGCPFRRSTRTLALAGTTKKPSKTIRIRKLERRLLRGGASVKVLVSRAGEIGKYTRFKIRRSKPPLRSDLCLAPSSTAPLECPS